MPLTISDEQLREVEFAAGNKWNRVRDALGIEKPVAPSVPVEPSTPYSTYHAVKRAFGDDRPVSLTEGGHSDANQGRQIDTSEPDRQDATPEPDLNWESEFHGPDATGTVN